MKVILRRKVLNAYHHEGRKYEGAQSLLWNSLVPSVFIVMYVNLREKCAIYRDCDVFQFLFWLKTSGVNPCDQFYSRDNKKNKRYALVIIITYKHSSSSEEYQSYRDHLNQVNNLSRPLVIHPDECLVSL